MKKIISIIAVVLLLAIAAVLVFKFNDVKPQQSGSPKVTQIVNEPISVAGEQ